MIYEELQAKNRFKKSETKNTCANCKHRIEGWKCGVMLMADVTADSVCKLWAMSNSNKNTVF